MKFQICFWLEFWSKNKQLHFQTRILMKIFEEFQSHLKHFPIELPISILIKIVEEFYKISTAIWFCVNISYLQKRMTAKFVRHWTSDLNSCFTLNLSFINSCNWLFRYGGRPPEFWSKFLKQSIRILWSSNFPTFPTWIFNKEFHSHLNGWPPEFWSNPSKFHKNSVVN